MSLLIKSRTEENRRYYDKHISEIKKYTNEYYHANKTDETIKLNRQRAKANYELKKEQIKERNLARYYDKREEIKEKNLARYYTNLTYSDNSSSDEDQPIL